jgi:hypothetical protein
VEAVRVVQQVQHIQDRVLVETKADHTVEVAHLQVPIRQTVVLEPKAAFELFGVQADLSLVMLHKKGASGRFLNDFPDK